MILKFLSMNYVHQSIEMFTKVITLFWQMERMLNQYCSLKSSSLLFISADSRLSRLLNRSHRNIQLGQECGTKLTYKKIFHLYFVSSEERLWRHWARQE